MVNKLVIENLAHRPIRTTLSILAISIEVTMMLTLVGLSRGMLQDSQERARGVGADVWVRPPGTSVMSFSTASLPEKIIDFFEKQPHVMVAAGTISQPVSGLVSVSGIDFERFTKMSGGFEFVDGGPWERRGDLIVDTFYAEQNGKKAGETIRLLNRDWRLVGIVRPGKLNRLMVDLHELQDLTGHTGKISQVWLKLDDPANTRSVIDSLKATLKDYQIYSVQEFTSLFTIDAVPGLKAFIYIVIGISVVVGFLVVFLSMYTAVLERTREIGVLKALGATPAFVLGMLVRETALLAIAGSILGIVLTYGARWVILTLVPSSLKAVIVPDWWPIAAAISLAGALLGALYPGLKAARQDPIEALAYE